MSLHVARLKRASGDKFRIRYWKGPKHLFVPMSEHPEFQSFEEAKAFCKQQNGKLDAERHLERFAKGLDAQDWKSKYSHFEKEIEKFLLWHKKEAPNSWEASKSWLQNFIVPYFLKKNLNNPNLWHTEFENFRTWVEEEATVSNGRKKLSYSSRIHIIKALNSFIRYLGISKQITPQNALIKCRGFNRALASRRGLSDLIKDDEYQKLKAVLGVSRGFFITLMNTGARIHELYSLPFSNVFIGKEELDENLVKPFEEMGKTIFGYIRLESQMKEKYNFRNPETGCIARKPLKSKKSIGPRTNRIIPIVDEETWNILVENRRRAMAEWEGRAFLSSNSDDYLLFNLNINQIRRDFRSNTKKTPHCCRHSFTTNTVKSFRGINYGPELIKSITGHSSSEFEKYVHLIMEEEDKDKKKVLKKF